MPGATIVRDSPSEESGKQGLSAVPDNTEVFHRMIDALGLVVESVPATGESESEVEVSS